MALDRVVWAFENQGLRVPLHPNDPAAAWVKGAGMSGTSVAPTTLKVDEAASGGGRFRSNRRKPRTVTVPVLTFGKTRAEVEPRLRTLLRALDDRWGAPVLVATYPDGTVFDSECHLAGGGDQQWGSSDTDGRTYCRWVLQVTCPDPYFTARQPTRYVVGVSDKKGLLNGGSLVQMRLTSTQVFGNVAVTNPGDVETWPVWEIHGPGAEGFTITSPTGQTVKYAAPLDIDTVITVDMGAKTVTDQTGANRYPELVGAPGFWPLPPGQSTVQVLVPQAGVDTRVVLDFQERREVIY